VTTTSYAILGLLAVQPFTTYELAQQMDRALGSFWPRARSKIYEEPKKLVALGLARASAETVGKRPRTVYRITPRGRRALEAWVSEPGAGPSLEFEQLVQVFFAEMGSKADLLATLDAARHWSDDETLATGYIAKEYLDGRGGFPERLPWLILVGQLLEDFVVMIHDWATWASDVVDDWPDDLSAAAPDLSVLERQVERLEQVSRRTRTAAKEKPARR
jgi:DNA-binding PadR family transcriptional regulator